METKTLMVQVEKVAAEMIANPNTAMFKKAIEAKVSGLKKNLTAKYAEQVIADLLLIAEKAAQS